MSEFETYTVKVLVKTSRIEEDECPWFSTKISAPDAWRVPSYLSADTEAEARANHAVACAMFGLPNAWPVSEGELTIETFDCEYPGADMWHTRVLTGPLYAAGPVLKDYPDWPT